MDREPFATYRTYPRGLMADGFVDGKQYAYLSVTQAKHQIPIINDAHEARVKEAVREAVEEFREKAVNLMREHPCTASIYGGGEAARGAKSAADYMAFLVESLPTEPEGE